MESLDPAVFRDRLSAGLADAGLPADPEAVDRLVRHARLLDEWTARMNLVGLKDRLRWVDELYLDSARMLPAVTGDGRREDGPAADLGSGAGFPGLVLAAFRPEREWLLIDSNGKKTSFLSAAAEAMGLLRAEVVQTRLEEFGRGPHRGRLSAAVFKALGPWAVGMELAMPLVRPGGTVAFFQGRDPPTPGAVQAVAGLLGGGTVGITTYRLPGADADRHVVRVVKTGPTPRSYPRKVGIPERQPLR
jgi:16S rRNA (guanine527-N7)-methyltransferase